MGRQAVDDLLTKYREKFDYNAPLAIDKMVYLMEDTKGITIELREDEKERSFEALLIPRDKGFVIKLNKNACSSWLRKRNTYAHELAHVFFYDLSPSFPVRLYEPPESLCFKLARELLVPEDLLRQHLCRYPGHQHLQLLRGLSEDFQVSLEIMALRLTEDTDLLSDVMFTFWRCKENAAPEMPYRYENFAKTAMLPPSLKGFVNSYRRNKHIHPIVWNRVLTKLIGGLSSFSEENLEILIRQGKRHKVDIKFRAEAATWRKQMLPQKGRAPLDTEAQGLKKDFVSAQVFELKSSGGIRFEHQG